MTKQECAIIMAYTGRTMLVEEDMEIFYKYIEGLLGGPVYTHELADIEVRQEIHEKSRPDFIRLCREATDQDMPTNVPKRQKELSLEDVAYEMGINDWRSTRYWMELLLRFYECGFVVVRRDDNGR